MVDVGDIKTENENVVQILVFNTDHIPLLTEKIDEVEFNYEVDGQFINIDLPEPNYKQLLIVDDLNEKNSGLARLTRLNPKQLQGHEQHSKMISYLRVLLMQFQRMFRNARDILV